MIPETPMTTPETMIEWKKFDDARPYPVVMGIVHDGERILILHRSTKVRSAQDCWSMPSGLHEVGKTLGEQLDAELGEEFNLKLEKTPIAPVYTFENIRPNGDGWHWVIMIFIAKVASFDNIINHEPDKHDEYKLVTPHELTDMLYDPRVKWGHGLQSALTKLRTKIDINVG